MNLPVGAGNNVGFGGNSVNRREKLCVFIWHSRVYIINKDVYVYNVIRSFHSLRKISSP